MPQWETVAGQRRIRRHRDVHLHVVKERHPSTNRDPDATAYRMPMGDGHEIRESWADYLRRMTSRPGWSVARLARESGIHRATIFKWIAGKGGANMASVESIAKALGDDPSNALRAAGDMVVDREEGLDPDLKVILRRLADPDVSDAEKISIRATLRYLAELAERAAPPDSDGRREAS